MSLFTDIEEVKKYTSVAKGFNIGDLLPHVEHAEMELIKPLLGDELFDELVSYYTGSEEESEIMEELLKRVQRPLAHYAFYLGADEFNVHVTNTGFQVFEGNDKKVASEWRVNNIKASWLKKAHTFAEALLDWLEKNIEEDDLSSWKDSDAYTKSKELFINKASEFNEELYIDNSRMLLVSMKPIMRSIERKYIKPTISEAFFDELKEYLKDSSNDSCDGIEGDAELKVIELIRPAIVHLTMARALRELPTGLFPEELYKYERFDSFKNPIVGERKEVLMQQLQSDGEAEIKALQKFLDTNADNYQTYKESSCYVEPITNSERGEYKNDSDSGIFVC